MGIHNLNVPKDTQSAADCRIPTSVWFRLYEVNKGRDFQRKNVLIVNKIINLLTIFIVQILWMEYGKGAYLNDLVKGDSNKLQ